jgi:hypothetical protein
VVFGLTRGLAVFAAWRITTPDALNSFHRRFDRLGATTRRAMIAVEVIVAGVAIAVAVAWRPIAAGVLVVACVVVAALKNATTRRTSSRRVDLRASIQ